MWTIEGSIQKWCHDRLSVMWKMNVLLLVIIAAVILSTDGFWGLGVTAVSAVVTSVYFRVCTIMLKVNVNKSLQQVWDVYNDCLIHNNVPEEVAVEAYTLISDISKMIVRAPDAKDVTLHVTSQSSFFDALIAKKDKLNKLREI